jgi:hypothetical protein
VLQEHNRGCLTLKYLSLLVAGDGVLSCVLTEKWVRLRRQPNFLKLMLRKLVRNSLPHHDGSAVPCTNNTSKPILKASRNLALCKYCDYDSGANVILLPNKTSCLIYWLLLHPASSWSWNCVPIVLSYHSTCLCWFWMHPRFIPRHRLLLFRKSNLWVARSNQTEMAPCPTQEIILNGPNPMLKPPSTSIEHLAKSFHKVKYIYFVRKIFSSIVFIVLSIFFLALHSGLPTI